ncbi:cutinase family protein [Frankia sp. AgB32]|uniref:cutinase family protein n=1 Tax=Frankia sp. AgB32 TaxID=631119 RepID=UPI00200DE067|nr:cutinase family protein [Frankia sp. AgB32]MCK9893325.1 cutinase family protein [Frankia sp. AgB32]
MKVLDTWRKRAIAATTAALACLGGGLFVTAGTAYAATCSDADVAFVRGSTELPGPGLVGTPFTNAVMQNLPGRTVTTYGVDHAANIQQTSAGPGATDMTRHVTSVAATCPNTKFMLGGHTQGASVTDISIGIPTFLGTGARIPTNLASRVSAVVVFGHPLALTGGKITSASQLYGPKAKEFCEPGDPVCANRFNGIAHLLHAFDGSATDGGRFAASKVLGQ